ncbi:MAG: CoA transferase subunit A [Candidatus Cloacimonadota bacterium]
MPKIISASEAAKLIQPNCRLLIGGFLAVGAPEQLIDAIVAEATKDLHIVVIASDYENRGIGKLVVNHQVKSAQVSHLGTNKAIQAQMNSGEIEIELVPQGTLMERVRAYGFGLGGVLTPTGLGTVVQEKKQIITQDGKDYLLEPAIGGDVAIIRAKKADKMGNLVYAKTSRNSNPIMATAAPITIAEVDEIVEIGQIDPEDVVTPGIFVTHLVLHKEENNG